MCGIAGIISANPQLVNRHRLKQMTDVLAHRGPDGEQQWVSNTGLAGLGHRRLAIIDLSANAAQPLHYLNRYSIIHNGEIYNYLEIRAMLSDKGYQFHSLSDTEVLVAAYDCWKQDCLQYLDGMFAFAVWDEQQQTLFAARDRFGEKPFYYHHNGQELIFASEIKALWAAGIVKKVNERLLFNFITLGYTQNPVDATETAYQQVFQLPAASFFYFKPGENKTVEPIIYWKLDKDNVDYSISENAATEKFTQLFEASVQRRLRSDVDVGTSLSGGLDSSSIAVTIQKLNNGKTALQTFSAIFPGTAADESAFVQLLTREKHLENHTTVPLDKEFEEDFEKLCYHQEGFMGSASVYAQYRVFQLAKLHNVKVLLDGQGADEVLAGYHKYYHWFWQQLYKNNKHLLEKEIAAARELGINERWTWRNKLAAVSPAAAAGYAKTARVKKQLTAANIDKQFAGSFGKSYYQLPVPDSLQNVLYYNTFTNGLGELLQYADRNSMAHGRETRLPFLSHQLVEFAFSLPAHFKISHGRTKWLLRNAMDGYLPKAITWRKDKIGFEPPQQQWLQYPSMQARIHEARKKLVTMGILKKQVLHSSLQLLDAQAADNFDWRYLVAAAMC